MKRKIAAATALLLVGLLTAGFVSCASGAQKGKAVQYKAGTYEAAGQGNNGQIKVAVTFSENAITEVRILGHEETPGISDPAIARIPGDIVKAQSLAVDTVSGATHSSRGILEAVEKAVIMAGADPALLKGRAVQRAAGAAISKTADVVIIGGGGAGMAAAASAAEAGAKVIVIEKTAALGGNTLASGCAWNAADPEKQSRIPTLKGQTDTLKAVLDMDGRDFGEYAGTLETLKGQIRTYLAGDTSMMFDSVERHMIQAYLGGKRKDRSGIWYSGKFDLVRKLCSESLPVLKWAESIGVVFDKNLSAPVGAMWTRGHNPIDKKSYFDAPSKLLAAHGGEIMLETRATSLIIEKGRVVGVKAEKTDGTQVTLRANKGVIMATGGYGANAAMVAEYNNYWPSIPADMKCTCVASATGDGITMAKAAGANLVGMQFTQLMPTAHAVTGQLIDGILVPPQNYVFVNKQGKRFVNEYAERDVLAFAALSQTDGIFYHIADTTMALNSNTRPTQAKLDSMVKKGILYRADTLEGLAALIGIPADALVETVKKYNSYVDAGKDPEFGKNVFGLKIVDGPFYAVPEKPAIHHTMGGIEINVNAQALGKDGRAIPGLYAAGEVTGGIHAGNRLGGNAIADVWVFGKTAGASAASGL